MDVVWQTKSQICPRMRARAVREMEGWRESDRDRDRDRPETGSSGDSQTQGYRDRELNSL